MNDERHCLHCKRPLPVDAPEGLCPVCLVGGALAGMMVGESAKAATIHLTLPEVAPPAGNIIRYFGDYELLEEVARGGMGVVWKARQVSLNRVVALKMILAGNLATEAEVQRFHIEAEAAANLQHPNIVAIHEVGEHLGQHYFSMDYVDGKNLAELTQGEPLNPTTAARYVQTLAEAVHFAHQHGTLHRDLKPQNVLIDSTGQLRITDFGLAKRMNQRGDQTRPGVVMGTPNYMPPEQAAGRQDRVGPHSDIYSLGAILYELVTGKPPFQAETVIATLAKVLEEPPVAPCKLNPRVPSELETICLKCLEKEPSRRYASARELAEDLGRLLRREPIRAQPPSTVRKTVLWFQRNPWVLTGVISAITVGLVWLTYALWAENRDLVWEKIHPGEVRPVDGFTEIFAEIPQARLASIILLPWFVMLWARPFEQRRRERIMTGKRIPAEVFAFHGIFSVIWLALALYLGTVVIDFHRWDNHPAMQRERTAKLQTWQSRTNLLLPQFIGNKPRVEGSSKFTLVFWLAIAFYGTCTGASQLRKLGHEYLFVMFPSTEAEEIERYRAQQEKLREDQSFGVFRARPRTVLRLTAIGSILGLGIVVAFVVVVVVDPESASYLVIPAAMVIAWTLSVAAVALRQGPSRRWFVVKSVTIAVTVAAVWYLFAQHEHGLVWIGLVFGFLAGVAHGSALRNVSVRCQRWNRRKPTGSRFVR